MKKTILWLMPLALAIMSLAKLSDAEIEESSALTPVRLESPRDTLRSFLEAMNDYRKGLETGNERLKTRLGDAVRTLDLSQLPEITRGEAAPMVAIWLKEVIDRIVVIELSRVPEATDLPRWRLKGSEIVIARVTSGDQEGLYLFSAETVARARDYYLRVRHLPYLAGSGLGAGYQDPWLERHVPKWLKSDFLGFKNWQWLGLFIAITLGLVLRRLGQATINLILRLTSGSDGSRRHKILSALEKPVGLSLASAFWFFSAYALQFDGLVLTFFVGLIKLLFGVSLVWAIYRLSFLVDDVLGDWARRTDTRLDDQLVPLLSKSLRIFLVAVGLLLTIQNLGFNVVSVLAGLGLGGLALALAAQDTAANLFGSIMILLDRPFQIGDWIVTAGAEGNVEQIGFRSTRIRTFYDSVISVPNSALAKQNIDNMGRRQARRTRTTLGVLYSTTPDQMQSFIAGIKKIILDNPYSRKDKVDVAFAEYGESSLNNLVNFFLQVSEAAEESREREAIYLAIYRLAESLGVGFAYPTRTIYLENSEALKSAEAPTV